MKVLHLIARMNVGGTARYLTMLSNGLEANGIESAIATGFVQGAEAEDPSVAEVKLHRIKHLGRAINPIADHLAFKEIVKLVAEIKPDIIHSHTFKAGFFARARCKSLIKAANKEIKFVHTFHGHLLDDPEFSGLKKTAIVTIERALAKRCDKLITVGQKVAEELLENEIGQVSQYLNIPPGIKALTTKSKEQALADLGLDNDKPIIGWLARVTGVKNPLIAVEIAKQIPKATFIFGGSGDLLDQLKAKAPANSRVFGWIDAATFISACDIILSTSENEGMPIALIEAQLAGKPVVATNVGSTSEVVINNETGIVTSKEINELISALNRLLTEPDTLSDMSDKAIIHVSQSFSPSAMVQKHLDLYRLLV